MLIVLLFVQKLNKNGTVRSDKRQPGRSERTRWYICVDFSDVDVYLTFIGLALA